MAESTVTTDMDNGIETASNCSYEETAAKIECALRKSLKLADELNGSCKEDEPMKEPGLKNLQFKHKPSYIII